MKQSFLSIILFALFAIPCPAQWKYAGTNVQALAFGVHDTSLFVSYEGHLGRHNPNGEADTGINFSYGNISSFASLGRYFFANIGFGYSFRSSDNGSHWQQRPGGKAIISNGQYLIARYQYFQYRYMSISRDSGASWDSVGSFDAHSFAANGICIFANTGDALWRSLDTGAAGSWVQLPSPPFFGTMMTMNSLLFMYDNYRSGTQGANNGVLILSRDSGKKWDTVRVDSAGKPEYITYLATDGKNLFAGGVSSTIDSIDHVHRGNGVYVSTDTGQHWRAVNDGLTTYTGPWPFMNIEAMCVYDTFLYISTNNQNGDLAQPSYATYYRPIREMVDTTSAAVEQVSPLRDTLAIYPNPATGVVTIFAGSIIIERVSVLSVLGVDVLTTPPSPYPLPEGEGTMVLDLSHLPSGTYFLRIETAAGSVLRKVVRE